MRLIEKTLLARVAETIDAHSLLVPGQRVLVAVSGGADSVCLLDVLLRLGYAVEVAHFDHQTREGESAKDAAFVRRLAEARGLPFQLASRAVASEAAATGQSFELHARAVRYEFLCKTAQDRQCTAVATGHHSDDQAETVLMRLVRGAGPHGLAGIPYARDEQTVRVVRPMLDCTRSGILAYLGERGLEFREDASNTSRDHFRNRVRHELLPLLAQDTYNPGIIEALTRLSDIQRTEDAYLTLAAEQALATVIVEEVLTSREAIVRDKFRALHEALQRRVLALAARRAGAEPTFLRVETARHLVCEGATGAQCDLGGGMSLANGRDTAHFIPASKRFFEQAALVVPGVTHAFSRWFAVRYLDQVPREELKDYCGPERQVFDADALRTPLIVRSRRIGDRFTPYGMSGSKKIQDYFVDRGVPAPLRDQTPLLVAGHRIAWVVGHAIDSHAAITEATQTALAIEVDYDPE